MKQYPSILKGIDTEHEFHVFDKCDGSNLRFEFNRKKGFVKYGTRHRLLDAQDPDFGKAIQIFTNHWSDKLAKIAQDNRWESAVFFCEFWGVNSFAGLHNPEDPKILTLFDVSVYKRGLLPPREFLKLFEHLPIPRYLGKHRWTRGFVETVRNNELDGITFEGVVGKAQDGKRLLMYKAKTQSWVDKVRALHDPQTAEALVNS